LVTSYISPWPRAYVTSAYQIDFHIDENKIPLHPIFQFLVSAGKVRQSVADKHRSENNPSSSSQVFSNQAKLITIGLRQTLKAYNGNKLKWILLDSTTVSPSAVGQVMGLMATNGTKETKFAVILELSSTFSKILNIPKVSAVGFGPNCIELEEIFSNLHPIDIVLKKKPEINQPLLSSSTFVLPQLEVPKGKTHKISKKQRKMGKK
jgi:hypothetical protein